MKKFISGLCLGIVLMVMTVSFAATQTIKSVTFEDITLRVNGKTIYPEYQPIQVITNENPKYVKNYVTVRDVAEALGCQVYWDGETQTVDIISATPKQTTIEDVAKNVEKTVFLSSYSDVNGNNEICTGSGVLIDEGIVVTNHHVVESAIRYGIVFNDTEEGREQRVSTWLNLNPGRDIGIISVKDNREPALLGDSDNLRLGQKVIAIGSPLGLKNTVSEGIVSGFRTIDEFEFIQITCPISPGSSGGGLFNMDGELVGITTMKIINGESLNFAIPINDVKAILDEEVTTFIHKCDQHMKWYSYDGDSFYFNCHMSVVNDVINLEYSLYEEWEGSKNFTALFESNNDFNTHFCEQIDKSRAIIESYGFKDYVIVINSENDYIRFRCTNLLEFEVTDCTFELP